ncbi:ATP-binding protein [Cysteiniphilum sp. 6C5]|uniref:ATP-binding protein n=1 Tax=unclassified Cysteiniphilum TaxID=2610889 RepID=UPI003F838389
MQKDIIEFLKLGKPDVVIRLVGLLAHSSGQLLNFQQLAADCHVNVAMLRNYIDILEQTFVIQLIKPFVGNKRTELTSNPICYFIDNGFRNKALDNFLPLENRTDMGLLVESFVFQELLKFKAQYRKPWQIHYWRTKGGAEVDFVLSYGVDQVIPIEVKYRNMTKLTITRGYRSFIEVYQPKIGFVVSKDQRGLVQILDTKIHFIPLEALPKLLDYL